MRSLQEQRDGLDIVALRAVKSGARLGRSDPKTDRQDVCYLFAWGIPMPSEVVYAVGGYDIWKDGHLAQTDLSAEQAAQVLIDEYRKGGA